jgi:hypothetical protein
MKNKWGKIEWIELCKTPTELSFVIWTKELEQAMGDRSSYRLPFVEWIECYKNKLPYLGWKYATPKDLAEDIYKIEFDRFYKDKYYQRLRDSLIKWIDNYVKN